MNIAIMVMISIIFAILQIFFPDIKTMGGWYVWLLIYSAIVGFIGSFISLFLSKWMAKRTYNIELLTEDSARGNEKLSLVWKTVQRIARENNIEMPEVGFYESPDPNAFATGASKNSSLVAVSTGLLNMMNLDEIEGVVAHEMAHILNGDMVTMTLLQGVMNTFVVFISNIAARAIENFFSKEGEGFGILAYNLVYILLQVIFGFLASLVVMYFSRIREYHADAGWAKYTSKTKMIAGLKKLKEITSMQIGEQDKKMAPFMITEPDNMFSTHPSLDNRIKALQENFSIK